jgi:hypothetical protein
MTRPLISALSRQRISAISGTVNCQLRPATGLSNPPVRLSTPFGEKRHVPNGSGPRSGAVAPRSQTRATRRHDDTWSAVASKKSRATTTVGAHGSNRSRVHGRAIAGAPAERVRVVGNGRTALKWGFKKLSERLRRQLAASVSARAAGLGVAALERHHPGRRRPAAGRLLPQRYRLCGPVWHQRRQYRPGLGNRHHGEQLVRLP